MTGWLLRRLAQSALVVVLMSLIVFIGLHAIAKPVDILIGDDMNQQERLHAIARLGLDQPLWRQYAVERARIRVEAIVGPVLPLSGTDDGNWPSSLYRRMIVERLARFSHPYLVEHLDIEGPAMSSFSPIFPPRNWSMPTRPDELENFKCLTPT